MKKRLQTAYFIFLIACFVILLVLELFSHSKSFNPIYGELIIITLISVPSLIWIVYFIVRYFFVGYKRIRLCEDKLFDELDFYNSHWGESKEHYENLINVINFYYKDGGKVDMEVGNDLKRLYNRYDFLKVQLGSKDFVLTCFTSVSLSIFSTLVCRYVDETKETPWFYSFFLAILFVAIMISKNYFRGESDRIYEYELKLLNAKIKRAEKAIQIDYQREDYLLTKQIVVRCLIRKRKHLHGKRAEEIENDMKIVEQLNLNLINSNSFKEVSFFLGRKRERGVLFVDAKNRPVNDQYEKLYEVLVKYDLINKLPDL